jgi:cell division protein FtsB
MKNRNNIFKTVAILALTFVCIYLIVTLNFRINEQKAQIEELQKSLDEQKERVEKLRYELDRPYDDEYAIEIARDKLNYHLPGEIIFYNGRSD